MTRRIGAHVSTAGGYHRGFERAVEIGADCMQIFSSSPRVWGNNWQKKLDHQRFAQAQKDTGVSPVFTHALYLVNLSSDKKENVDKSIQSLIHEMEFDAAIAGQGVVVHLGSHQGRGWQAMRAQVAKSIQTILDQSPPESRFLIENSAGQNGKLTSDLSEVLWLLDELHEYVAANRLGWCFDTCHGFAAGYYLGESSPDASAQQRGSAIDTITTLDLWSSLHCIHVNDSKGAFASGIDRHDNIGDGALDQKDLQFFLTSPQVQHIPLILEVPGITGKGPDAQNIQRLRDLA